MKALIAYAVGAFLVLALAFTLGYQVRDAKADREALAAQNEYLSQLEDARKGMQGAMNDLSKQWVEHNRSAKAEAQSTVDRLRDAGITLRVRLADATVAAVTGSGGRQSDGTAELHPDTSGFLVEQAQRADKQVTLLQEAVRALQGEKIEQGQRKP